MTSLAHVIKDLKGRNDVITESLLDNDIPKDKLESIIKELDTIENQLIELYGNIKAMKWCLGEVDDLDFAINTATSVIERTQNRF